MKEQVNIQNKPFKISGISLEEEMQEIIETLGVLSTDPEEYGQIETRITVLGKDHTISVTMNNQGQYEIDTEDDLNSDFFDVVKLYASENEGDEFVARDIEIDVFAEIEKKINLFIMEKEFDDNLKVLNISQDEFCERMSISQQEVSEWKLRGNYPSCVKNTMKGVLAVKRDEKTIVINGEDCLYIEDVFKMAIDGLSLSVFENQDTGEYLVVEVDRNLNVNEAHGNAILVKIFETLEAIHAFAEDVLEKNNNNEFAAYLSFLEQLELKILL